MSESSPHLCSGPQVCTWWRSPIQTGCHLEGFDELSCAHATGTLGNDASETHLPLQVDLALNKSLNESFWVNTNNIWTPNMYLTSKPNRRVYLDPGVLVVCRRGPSINESLVIQSGQFGPPALQSQNAIVHRRGRNLRLGDASSFHSQQRDASWEPEPDISRYSSTQETNRLTVRQTDG